MGRTFLDGICHAETVAAGETPDATSTGTEMTIPTKPIGSIPRPPRVDSGGREEWRRRRRPCAGAAVRRCDRDTIARFEATGSPVISDGRAAQVPQLLGLLCAWLAEHGARRIQDSLCSGPARRMPRLAEPPFRYKQHADRYLEVAKRYAHASVKQAVISPSALSLLYPVGWECRLLARTVHRRSAGGARR